MRKFFLITAMVLASATAQAAERSLTLGSDTPVAAPAKAGRYVQSGRDPEEPAEGRPRYLSVVLKSLMPSSLQPYYDLIL